MVSAGRMPARQASTSSSIGAHPARRLVRRARQARRGRTEEHAVDEAQRIGDAEHAPKVAMNSGTIERLHRALHPQGFGEEHLLGKKAVEQRHARHRRGRDHGERAGDRHEAPKAAQPRMSRVPVS